MRGKKWKPKKRVSVGAVERRYLHLFKERLIREGRYQDFRARCRDLYHSGLHATTAHWKAAREFGYQNSRDEVSRYEEYMIFGGRTKMQKELAELQEEIKEERLSKSIPVPDDLDLPPDIAWVYSHPAMRRVPQHEGDRITLRPGDHDGAPSTGAIGMLQYFANNKDVFYKLVLTHLSKKDKSGEEEKAIADDMRDASEITKMLEHLDE